MCSADESSTESSWLQSTRQSRPPNAQLEPECNLPNYPVRHTGKRAIRGLLRDRATPGHGWRIRHRRWSDPAGQRHLHPRRTQCRPVTEPTSAPIQQPPEPGGGNQDAVRRRSIYGLVTGFVIPGSETNRSDYNTSNLPSSYAPSGFITS